MHNQRFFCPVVILWPHSVVDVQETPEARVEALEGLSRLYRTSGSWQGRSGAALAMASCAPAILPADVPPLLDFLMAEGVLDSDPTVRSQMVEAGKFLRGT